MMDILSKVQFENPNENNGVIKATIHKTGKLGFSSAAQSFLNLGDESYFKIGFDPENLDLIYLVPTKNESEAFKAAKAGDYYYINLKHVFDKRNFDYQNKTIIYDIRKQESSDVEFFILNKRR